MPVVLSPVAIFDQVNPPQPDGLANPVAPQTFAPPAGVAGPPQAAGGWSPTGPIPSAPNVHGNQGGYGVIISPANQAPPNTTPGISAVPSAAYPPSSVPVPLPVAAVDLWLQTGAGSPAQAPPGTHPNYQAPSMGPPGQAVMPAGPNNSYLTLRPITINLTGVTGNSLICGGAGRVQYVGAREATGAAGAQFTLWDATVGTGRIVTPYTFTAGQSVRENYQPHGLDFYGDLWLSIDSGSVVGSVIVWPEDLVRQLERLGRRELDWTAIQQGAA